MNTTPERVGCTEALETFHRVLDGDLMDAADRTRMESHLTVCSECAEKAAQLREMQDLLRGIAESPLPETALRRVRARTVESEAGERPRRAFDWRFAAAAAMIVFGTWIGVAQFGVSRTDEELVARQAAQEARLVLQLTANALKRTERVTMKAVFADEISLALRKVGVRFPKTAGRVDDEGVEL